MNKDFKRQLVEKVETLCPRHAVEVREFNRQNDNSFLLVIRDDCEVDDVDDWAINCVYGSHAEILRLLEADGLADDAKMMFCHGNYFVFYDPQMRINPFSGFAGLECSNWYGSRKSKHVVGVANDVNEAIDFLLFEAESFSLLDV